MPPKPTDAYGRSKLEAEELAAAAGVPLVVFRPVLVHGPGMRFNMAALMDLALTRWPLPFGAFHARRSILARGHLADAVLLALENRAMEGGTFLVADPDPLSVRDMVAAIRAARQRRPGVFPLPQGLVAMAGRWMGREEAVERLRRPLVADPSRLMAAGWRPRLPAFEALTETARTYV
jgi:UDP-glucose 4-epimerase